MTEPYSTMEATYLLLKKNRFADHNGRYRLANILRSDNKRPLNVEPIETSAICEAVQLTCSVLNNGSAMNVRAWNEKKFHHIFRCWYLRNSKQIDGPSAPALAFPPVSSRRDFQKLRFDLNGSKRARLTGPAEWKTQRGQPACNPISFDPYTDSKKQSVKNDPRPTAHQQHCKQIGALPVVAMTHAVSSCENLFTPRHV